MRILELWIRTAYTGWGWWQNCYLCLCERIEVRLFINVCHLPPHSANRWAKLTHRTLGMRSLHLRPNLHIHSINSEINKSSNQSIDRLINRSAFLENKIATAAIGPARCVGTGPADNNLTNKNFHVHIISTFICCGQLLLGKSSKTCATCRCQTLRLTCTKFDFHLGSLQRMNEWMNEWMSLFRTLAAMKIAE